MFSSFLRVLGLHHQGLHHQSHIPTSDLRVATRAPQAGGGNSHAAEHRGEHLGSFEAAGAGADGGEASPIGRGAAGRGSGPSVGGCARTALFRPSRLPSSRPRSRNHEPAPVSAVPRLRRKHLGIITSD